MADALELTKRARHSKRIGANAERRAGAIYGVERWPANTGGPVDLKELPGGILVQVKAGATVTLATIIDGLDSARRAAVAGHNLGACHVEYHRAGKRQHRTLIVFEARDWAEWNGMKALPEEADVDS